jgi:uncharacterized protein YecT (DUF1311 family)
MTSYCRTLFAALLPLLWASAAAAQASFDCTKAATVSEKAICADPGLAAADAAMAQAFSGLLKKLPPAQQAALRTDQQSWITDRDGGCFDKKDDALTQCLLAATQMRRHFLAGEGDNGVAGAPALLPVFFVESRKGAYDITVAYAQFAAPAAPKFNAAVHEVVFGKNVLSQYRTTNPNPNTGSSNLYQVSYDTTYLDPNLASVTFQFADFAGGAHPNNWRSAVLWNPAVDAPVALADFLADPAIAVPAISALCKAQAEKDDWGLFDNPDFDTVVKDTKSWAVDKDGVTIMFDPYSVAPYVAGPHDCRILYADLRDLLKPGGPLPPK